MAEKVDRLVPVFKGKQEDWVSWRVKFRAFLVREGVWETLKHDRPEGAGRAAWDRANEKMFANLVLLTGGAALLVEEFEEDMNGMTAFKKLVEKYDQKTPARRTALHQELLRCELESGEDPDDYFVRIERYQRLLGQMGLKIEDAHLPGIILSRLPSSYDTLRTVLEAMDDLSYGVMKERMRAYYQRAESAIK